MAEPQYTVTKDNKRQAMLAVYNKVGTGLESGPVVVTLGRETRTPAQNDKLWPMLRDISKQCEWYGRTYSEEDWKDLFTAVLKGQRTAPGLEGGIVAFGVRTRKLPKDKFSDLIEYIYAFGSERNVHWSEQSLKIYEQYREAEQEQG